MKPFSDDTHPEAHRVQVELLRRMTPAQRLAIVARLNQATDAMALARLRAQYPGDTARDRRLRLAALKLGPALMKAAFDWDPEQRGW